MGKKSRRPHKKGKERDLHAVQDELMPLDMDSADKPKSVKESTKARRKRKKQLKKELKNKGHTEQHHEKLKQVGWHLLTVQGGSGVDKNFLFTSIVGFMDVEFQPLGFHKVDNKICFYLEANEPAANAVSGLSKRVQGSDGTRLKISAAKCGVPDLVLNSDQLKVLREVMSSRFNPAACLLDLTNLHHDPVLLEKDILANLTSPTVMKQTLWLIKENIPQLKALNLSKNNLCVGNLKFLQTLNDTNDRSSHLSALNLERNNIGDLQFVRYIKNFPLTELSLQFNPCFTKIQENPLMYVNAVKKELEHLKLLDGVDVNVYLAEDAKTKIEESLQSVSKLGGSFSGSSSNSCKVSEPLVRTFLEQYYALIDTPQRVDLVAAYTPDAVLEVKSSIASIASRVFGHSLISEVLTTLPATQHQHSTFSLDIQSLSIDAAQVVVTGQCQIAGVDTVATFSHSMTIVPFNTGLCCSRDVLELK